MSTPRSTNMALLTEGGNVDTAFYKHCPPDGGREHLDIGFYKHCPPDGGREHLDIGFYKHSPPDGGPDVSTSGSFNISLLTEGRNFSSPRSMTFHTVSESPVVMKGLVVLDLGGLSRLFTRSLKARCY